jgi:hypothetical protein
VAEAGRLCQQTVLGYLAGSSGQCVLAPAAGAQVTFVAGDRLLVVAEEF